MSQNAANRQLSETSGASVIGSLLRISPVAMRVVVLAISAFLALLISAVFDLSLTLFEERVGALGWTLNADLSQEERITLVAIDEPSIAEIGPWPWSREDMARLVTAIDAAGAQLQLYDVTYPEPRLGDDKFIAALQSANGALIAQVPALESKVGEGSIGQMTHPISGMTCNNDASQGATFAKANSFVASAASLSAVPKGHNAALIDNDGAVRRSPALVCVDDAVYPALSIAAFLQLGSADLWSGEVKSGTSLLDPAATLSLDGYPGLEIPLDSTGAMRISFAKSPEAFTALSAADVIQGRADPREMENAWVIIGGTAFGMADIVPTPYSGAAYGLELQARLLASILDVNVPYTPIGTAFFVVIVCLLFSAVLYFLAARGDRLAAYGLPAAAIFLPGVAIAIHIAALSSLTIWLGWVGPALFGLLAASGLLLLELGRVRLERARVFGNLNSYLPAAVAREIAFSAPSSVVNARRSNVTLLHADLRNFSAFSEARPPEEIAALLHFFLTRVTEIVEEKGGRVHEFRGDGILAIWDSACSATAHLALEAARSMQDSLNDRLLPEHALTGLEPLALGIGIEQGPVLIGSIGPAHRRSYTLLGDTVSITLRIQEMTAELAQPVLLGECAARQLNDVGLQSQGSYLLSGLRIPHVLFAPGSQASVSSISAKQPSLSLVGGEKP